MLTFFSGCNKSWNHLNNKVKGNSLNFDGIDDQLIVPNYEKLRLHSGTLEAWFKITKKNGLAWHALVAKELAYQITLFDYKLTGYDWKLEAKNIVTDSIPINEWHHTALTFIDSVENGCQLYLDGRSIGKPFKIHILNHGTELYIGSNRFNPQHFCGNIDEVRIWNSVRTPQEIYLNYLTEIDPTSTGLVLYYKFNEGLPEGDNQQKQFIQDETINNLTGSLYKFDLKGNTSNYSSDSPLIRKDFFSISAFAIKYLWVIISVLSIVLLTFLIVKLKTRFLIKENIKLDAIITERTKELKNSLSQKEVLIQEIHHRVKNNLQFILSIIDMQIMIKLNVDNSALNDVSRRLTAMALVHELLYRQENIERVSSVIYFNALIQNIEKLIESNKIILKYDIDNIAFSTSQCMCVGMIMSELISNSLKYAFINQKNPEIDILLRQINNENDMELTYKDNGIGFVENNTDNGLGSTLITAFTQQLKGSYNYNNINGVLFFLKFRI